MTDNIWNGHEPGGKKAPGTLSMTLHPGVALVLLVCLFVIGYVVIFLLALLLSRLMPENPGAVIRISTVIQDVVVFMVPAVVTAVLACRRPADLLGITRSPGLVPCLLAMVVMVVSIPALEGVIYWNFHWDWLPERWAVLARTMEDSAADTMRILLEDTSPLALIVNVLIIGVAAGLCEELFFRGIFLGLLLRTALNKHVAVWLTALIFSILHFQFYGCVPRLLLGVYFGYLFVWSRSLWLPVLAHVLNNSVYVITAWWNARQGLEVDSDPELWSVLWIAGSVVITAVALWFLWRSLRDRSHSPSGKRFISSM